MVSVPLLVDSGAITTALPPEFAQALNIALEDLPEGVGGGISGNFRYRRLESIKLIIFENEIELTGPIIFAEGLIGQPCGLLGREKIFDELVVGFRERIEQHVLLAVDKSA